MLESFASAFLAISLSSVSSQAAATTSQWDNDYGRARAHARSVSKPLLVIIESGSDSQQLVAPVRHQTAGGGMNLLGAFELCRVDASTEYGQKVAQAFNTEKLPYMAILDKTGRKIIYQHAGSLSDDQWQTALATHQRGELPRAVPVSDALPVDYAYFQQPLGMYGQSYCPSCTRGW
jgi:hypothetical protein